MRTIVFVIPLAVAKISTAALCCCLLPALPVAALAQAQNEAEYKCSQFMELAEHSAESSRAFSDGFYIGVFDALRVMDKAEPDTLTRDQFYVRLIEYCNGKQDASLKDVAGLMADTNDTNPFLHFILQHFGLRRP